MIDIIVRVIMIDIIVRVIETRIAAVYVIAYEFQ